MNNKRILQHKKGHGFHVPSLYPNNKAYPSAHNNTSQLPHF